MPADEMPSAPRSATPHASNDAAPSVRFAYRPELDGLRTFAVVVIVFFHAQVAGASSAFVVLDLFFVLSGFLVTNVVLSEMDRTGRLALGKYYARRARRLLPAAVQAIVVTSGVFVLVATEPERLELVRHAQAALVYLANWQFIADQADYFAGDIRSSPFMHYWSLSLEEQFYIVFPLLLLAWWKLAPGRGRVLLGLLGVLIGLSLTSQVVWGRLDPTYAYFATDTRMFQLLAGAAMAVGLREFARAPDDGSGGVRWPRLGRLLAAGGLVGYALLGTELLEMSVSHRNILATFIAGALVVGTYTAPASLVSRFFALPWLTYLGTISYGIYLWHWPAILVIERLFDIRPVGVALLALALACSLAALSYQLVETPIRRGRALDRFPWPVVATGLAVSVATALVVVGPVLSSSRAPVIVAAGSTGTSVATDRQEDDLQASLAQTVPDLDYAAIAQDRGPDDVWCTPTTPEDCLIVDGEGPHVVLVGDSHARAMAPALRRLAEEKGFRLSGRFVAGCPWPVDTYKGTDTRAERGRCREAGDDFYTRTLEAMDVDVVMAVNYDRGENRQGTYTNADGEPISFPRGHLRTVDRTANLVEKAGARLVMVRSVLGTGGWDRSGPDPLECLAQAQRARACAVDRPVEDAPVDAYYEAVAALYDSAATIDVNPLVCPGGLVCSPLLDGGQPVWRNQNHVAARAFVQVREGIWEQLVGTGLLED